MALFYSARLPPFRPGFDSRPEHISPVTFSWSSLFIVVTLMWFEPRGLARRQQLACCYSAYILVQFMCVHACSCNTCTGATPKKFKNNPRRLFRLISSYLCHQKPNPARETLPLNWSTKATFLYRYVGSLGSGQHLHTSVSILLALAQDSASPLVQAWALNALGP